MTQTVLGSIVALWRYPVKSMLGEELNAAEVTKRGLSGDRAYALVDSTDGKVASAKNPRKWPQLFDCHAALTGIPRSGVEPPPVRITLPDGTIVNTEQANLNQIFSKMLKREVHLSALSDQRTATAEEYWPDIEGLDHRDTGHRLSSAGRYFFRLCARTCAHHGHARSAARAVSGRAFRGPTVSPKHRGGDCEWREGFCPECLDRTNTRYHGYRSPEHYRSLSTVRNDYTPSERSPKGRRYPARSGSP